MTVAQSISTNILLRSVCYNQIVCGVLNIWYIKVHRLTLVKGVYSLRYFLHPMRIANLLMDIFIMPIYASPDFVYALDGGST